MSAKKNCRNNTKETYARHYKRIKEVLGWRKLNRLNLVVMYDALNGLRTDNERKNTKKILVNMLEKAVASDLIYKNVAKQLITEYTKGEGKYVFELHPAKTNKGLRDILVTAKAITALRQQYFVKQTLINKGKMPLDGYEDLVFVTKNNRLTTQFFVSECIDCTIKRIHKNNPDLTFEKFTPHCFRHTFATRYLEAGVPLKTVSALLGHAQLQLTTDLYMHIMPDSLFKGVEQYERAMQIG